jgi:hypothetical protein
VKKKISQEVHPTIPSDLASVPAASKITGIRDRTIWRWVRAGKVKAWGPRRCYRVSISELLTPVRGT